MSDTKIRRRHLLVVSDLSWSAGRNQRTEVEDRDPVTEVQDEAHVVVDQQDRHTCIAYRPQPIRQPEALGAVESRRWFIEQQETRVAG